MFGTVFFMKPLAGKEEEVKNIFKEWSTSVKPTVKGAKAGYLYTLADGRMVGVAVFESKEDYMANANNPTQDEWFKKLRANLELDPLWNDGEVLEV